MTTTYLSKEVLQTYNKYIIQFAFMIPGRNEEYYEEIEVIAKDIFDARKDAKETFLAPSGCYSYIKNIWH